MESEDQILLKDYSNEEKAAYFGALAVVASVDGHASPEELEFLRIMGEAAELPEKAQNEIVQIANKPDMISLQKCLEVLKKSELRFSFVTDIISFAKSDGKYTDEETEKIKGIADFLNINREQFSILDTFVDKANAAQQHGEDPTSQSFFSKSGMDDLFQKVGISPKMAKGMLGVVAPLVIAGMLSGGRNRKGSSGGMGGGLIGGLLAGALSRGLMGGGSGMSTSGGGLGSILSTLGGLSGKSGYTGMGSGGLGSILGNILGGNKK
ncbi:hypothetical protein P872_15390 [Rhodonellum psychrophilum GCM71 = DSM 17998]|uniref:Co-chaperone DjlA N-terminal domain-containing protein n=2 Tax=Rhodonellum TaxID=336827 RepID=U5BU56_9BACT|nr:MULTISPECIES: TerB family tellurite resistance protein [Rhodonellum]ERM84165.1 hypothetical protein P872_15390 [Rhodonellum psychrophilum GCM71 = DSM 17998]SDZ19835.1 Tellurite resistance protein TerB [Rhodonellum ikkaensis]